jgi:hypothetical protein
MRPWLSVRAAPCAAGFYSGTRGGETGVGGASGAGPSGLGRQMEAGHSRRAGGPPFPREVGHRTDTDGEGVRNPVISLIHARWDTGKSTASDRVDTWNPVVVLEVVLKAKSRINVASWTLSTNTHYPNDLLLSTVRYLE